MFHSFISLHGEEISTNKATVMTIAMLKYSAKYGYAGHITSRIFMTQGGES